MARLFFRGMMAALILIVAAAVAPIVSADDVTWDLSGVTFADGGTASGSFVYDADTNTVTSVDITTMGGSIMGATYTLVDPGYGPYASEIVFVTGSLADYTDTPALYIGFSTDLTDSGGTDPIALGYNYGEYTCNDTGCTSGTEVRGVTAGDVVAPTAKTPEPASLSLLLLGIGILGLAGMKRKMLPA
jgi:PEP-CTERM motif